MKYIKNKIILLSLGLGIILSAISFTFADDNTKPIIKTINTPTTSSVFVSFPEKFSGKVFTSCINGVCTSTSSPITEKEIKEIEDRLEEQRKAMREFFRKQQEFFNEMMKTFNVFNRFNNFPEFPKPSIQDDIKLTV